MHILLMQNQMLSFSNRDEIAIPFKFVAFVTKILKKYS